MHWLQRKKKTRTHFYGLFLKNRDFTVKKIQEMWSLLCNFFWFFPKWYMKNGQFLLHWTKWIQPLHTSLQTLFEHEQLKKTKKQFFRIFLSVQSNFLKNGSSKWVLVVCVAISASRRFIWTIKQHYPMIFHFHFRKGDSFDLGGSEPLPKGMDWSTTVFKVFFLDLMAFLIHINVRAKKITDFGF